MVLAGNIFERLPGILQDIRLFIESVWMASSQETAAYHLLSLIYVVTVTYQCLALFMSVIIIFGSSLLYYAVSSLGQRLWCAENPYIVHMPLLLRNVLPKVENGDAHNCSDSEEYEQYYDTRYRAEETM